MARAAELSGQGGASALHKTSGEWLGCGGCGGQRGRGCSEVPVLQGDIHKKERACLCLSFPPGKGQLNYLMQRGLRANDDLQHCGKIQTLVKASFGKERSISAFLPGGSCLVKYLMK